MKLIGCAEPKIVTGMEKYKVRDLKTVEKKVIITIPVLEKNVKKNGQIKDFVEYYLQCIIKDYYIKFCENKVNSEEIQKALCS